MVLKPTSDSLINMELWLPAENWNGKFMGVGNGGFAGSIQGLFMDMPQALLQTRELIAAPGGIPVGTPYLCQPLFFCAHRLVAPDSRSASRRVT